MKTRFQRRVIRSNRCPEPDDRVLQVLAGLLKGDSIEEVAEQNSVTYGYVARLRTNARKAGIPTEYFRKQVRGKKSATLPILVGICTGRPYDELAEEHGVTIEHVGNVATMARKAGMPIGVLYSVGKPRIRGVTMKILAGLCAGRPSSEIAEKCGVNRGMVVSVACQARKAGLPVPYERDRKGAGA
jgi:hypothetical protein